MEASVSPAAGAWWPVELAENVTTTPAPAVVGEVELALFRDREGVARAFEDLCPHRRARLSVAALTDQNWLQCRYHGWSFDVRTGQCVLIPNQAPDFKPPRAYAAAVFETVERYGFTFARLGGEEPGSLPDPWPDVSDAPALRSGVALIPMPHDLVVRALLETPKMLVRLQSPFWELVVEREPRSAHLRDGLVRVERYAQRKPPRINMALAKSMLLLTTETQAATGFTRLTLHRDAGPVELDMLLAPLPAPPYATRLMWRVAQASGAGLTLLRLWRMRRWRGEAPVAVSLAESRGSDAPGLAGEPLRLWRAASAVAPASAGSGVFGDHRAAAEEAG